MDHLKIINEGLSPYQAVKLAKAESEKALKAAQQRAEEAAQLADQRAHEVSLAKQRKKEFDEALAQEAAQLADQRAHEVSLAKQRKKEFDEALAQEAAQLADQHAQEATRNAKETLQAQQRDLEFTKARSQNAAQRDKDEALRHFDSTEDFPRSKEAEASAEAGEKDPTTTPNQPPAPPPPRYHSGGSLKLGRRSREDGLCLNAKEYAHVMAETIRASADRDDFVFALYGRWGRGKSTLMEQVKEVLEQKQERQDPSQKPSTYRTISFSAWKFPSRPEVWVHLYLCISKAALAGDFLQKWRIGFRVGVIKNGWLPLWLGLGLLLISRFHLSTLNLLFNTLGIVGLIILLSFLISTTRLVKGLRHSYAHMPDHSDKLGLQAVVGEDLKNLLHVWINKADKPDKTLFCHTIGLLILAIATISFTARKVYLLEAALPSWIFWLSLLGLIGLTIALFWSIAWSPPQRYDKALLEVDDLDRCEPEQMVAVIESLRLFLDDKDMSQRLQVVMLMDKEILEHALKNRINSHYPCEETEHTSKGQKQRESILSIREKYFVVELSLPPLQVDDIKKLAENIVQREYKAQVEQNISQPTPPPPATASAADLTTTTTPPLSKSAPPPPAFTHKSAKAEAPPLQEKKEDLTPDISVTFTSEEKDLLCRVIEEVFGQAPQTTPRAIRAFVLRYQIARLLLQHTNKPFEIEDLAPALAHALLPTRKPSSNNEATPAPKAPLPPHIEWAIQHVT